MSLDTLLAKRWKIAVAGALAGLPAAALAVWGGSTGAGGLAGTGGGIQTAPAGWLEGGNAVLPGPGALVAGALLLVPFALSTMRIWRRG